VALRIAIAGLGPRGREWARLVLTSPQWELVACAEPDARVSADASAALALPEESWFSGLEEALDARECDAVVVATPADRHEEPCERALERGLGVLVEKPFALSIDAAAALVAMAERQGVPLVVGQNLRYTRAHRTVRRLVGQGALGRIRLVAARHHRPAPSTPVVSNGGHAALWELAVHHLDALRHSVGGLSGVMAESFDGGGETPAIGRSVHALLAFENGAHGHYSASYQSTGLEFFERGQQFYERIVGERATLHVLQRWLVLCERGKRPRLMRRGRRAMTEEAILLRQLERGLLYGEPADASGTDNLGTVAILEACARSSSEGRWINPQEILAAHV
jgi:predicted dehydrogenase